MASCTRVLAVRKERLLLRPADELAADEHDRAIVAAAARPVTLDLTLSAQNCPRVQDRAGPSTWSPLKRSRDPSFAAKLADIVGLYLDPPAHAVVLSLDEKILIQALDHDGLGRPNAAGSRPAGAVSSARD
jgi:hypothetical protein